MLQTEGQTTQHLELSPASVWSMLRGCPLMSSQLGMFKNLINCTSASCYYLIKCKCSSNTGSRNSYVSHSIHFDLRNKHGKINFLWDLRKQSVLFSFLPLVVCKTRWSDCVIRKFSSISSVNLVRVEVGSAWRKQEASYCGSGNVLSFTVVKFT